MFITKKHIARRTFLRGAGVTLALPLLDSMVPAQTPLRKTAASPVRRFVGIWHPHGAAPGYWSPLQEGPDFDFSFITKPLEPFRDRVVLISGLDMPDAMATTEEPGGDHARGAVLLCGTRPRRNAVSPYLGVTIDQLIAQKYGQDTILSSIQLGVEDVGNFGNCNWGYSCAYTNSISWTSPTQPLPTEVNPRVAFERLFGDGASPEERLTGRKQNASILDSVTYELASLQEGPWRGRPDPARHLSGEHSRAGAADQDRDEQDRERTVGRDSIWPAGEQACPFPVDVRLDGAGFRGRYHSLRHHDVRPRPVRHQLPGIRL